jgi:hypothetical protein
MHAGRRGRGPQVPQFSAGVDTGRMATLWVGRVLHGATKHQRRIAPRPAPHWPVITTASTAVATTPAAPWWTIWPCPGTTHSLLCGIS